MIPRPTFDHYASDYQSLLEDSVSFAGQGMPFFARAKVYELRRLGRQLGVPLAKSSVLDVGSGNGMTDELLLPHVGRLAGVDVSPEMVAYSAARNPAAHYSAYDGIVIPFEDGAFDLVFTINVFHHVNPARWDAFATELWRVTRPNGLCVVIEHNPINPLTRLSVARCPFDEEAVLLGPARVKRALRRAGAGPMRHRYILFAPFGGGALRRAERPLGWCPLGAQYVVWAGGRHRRGFGRQGRAGTGKVA